MGTSETQSGVVIDGCYVPRDIYDAVKETARTTGKTQFIGVRYTPPPKPPEPEPAWANFAEMIVDALTTPPRYQAHLLAGAYCSYHVYASREDVPDGHIMILWISPQAA